MTALPPPTYYFNGITFNSAFYPQTSTVTSSSGNGITEAQANLLYLRKTTADTATSLETFSAGISTPSVNTSGNLLIGGNASTLGVSIGQATTTTAILGNESVTGNIVMNGTALTNYLQFPDGTQQFTAAAVSGNFVNFPTAQGALTIPSAVVNTTLKANTSLLTPNLDSPVGTTTFYVGNYNATGNQYYGSALSSGSLNIGMLQSTGALNIGTGTGRINTGGGTNGQINIGNGSTNAFGINIGGSSSTTAIGGELTASKNIVMNGIASTNYIQFPDGTKQYTAGGGAAGNYVNYPTPQGALTSLSVTGALSAGATTTSSIATGAITATSVERATVGELDIGNTANTTSLVLGGGAAASTIDMGVVASRTGLIRIGTGTGTGNVEIGGTGAGSTVTINNFSPASINTTGTISAQSLQKSGTAGILYVGNNANATSVYIGGGSATQTIAIGSSAVNRTGIIDIGVNSGGAATGDMNLGTGTGTGTVTIGGTGTGAKVVLNGTVTATGTLAATSATNATNAANSTITSSTSASTHYPTFVSAISGNQPELVSSGLQYVPSTNTLTAGTFSGNASTATTATNVGVTANASGSAHYPTFVSSNTTGSYAQQVGSLSYFPSTNSLTATNYIGSSLQRTSVGAMAVGSDSNTTSLTIGGGAAATTMDIGVVGSRTGLIRIGTGTGDGNVEIGGSGTVTVNGTLSGLVMKTSSIDTPSTAYALEIGKTNATTSQSYAGALTTNDLTIALSQTTGVINIGTGSGRINTGGAAKGAINIGTGAGANAFGINIGGSGTTTTIGGTLAVTGAYSPASITTSGMITANGGLTLGNSNILTLSDGTVAPTTPSQQFGNYSIAFSGTTLPASGTSIGTVSIAQAGTYWVMWHYEIRSTSSVPFPFFSILTRSSTTNNTLNTDCVYGFVTGTITQPQKNCNFGQQIFTQTNNTATSYGLTINYSGGTSNTQGSAGSFFRIFRLA